MFASSLNDPMKKKTILTKAITARGRAPPPPSADPVIHIDGKAASHALNMFDEMAGSQNVSYTYTEMLAESTVNLSAPLGDFDASYVEVDAEVNDENEDDDEVQEIEEADYDARVGRNGNYTETEDVKAWENISLDSIAGKGSNL
ncbi:uncharacterized protein LOC125556571 [Triticum urartu]|uniref:uncharacterized protein LOC125516114 n=1 Tax=Triticum urartu TaxID=4572 RepID=UPI0020435D7E|nr:uncharacterized protein LOC125516114 [Triticum urartu]XP_048575232.1 uncharacterized protein LOC125556570 [Triticum urartu]XP_048575233.1 uncharacterized protein LOC125556571 [Triticum urartu]